MKTHIHITPDEEEEAEKILATLEEGADEEEVTTHQEKKMPKEAVAVGTGTTQLATRVPSALYKRVKVFVVQSDTSVMEFVGAALAAELAKRTGHKGSKN